MINNNSHGNLFHSLNGKEQEELLIAYEESFDEDNLLLHEDVKLQHEKWLRPDQIQ